LIQREVIVGRSTKGERLFNPFKLKLLRKRIPASEVIFGAGFIAVLALLVFWVMAQKDNFDPSERDISFAVLQEDSVEDTLYRTPLKRWREPGTGGPEAPAVDLGIFPQSTLADDWSLDGRVETYDATNLYEKINGAAPQYISFGFRQLHFMTLGKDGHFVSIELYDMEKFRNALGMFVTQRGTDQRIEEDGAIAFYPTAAGSIGVVENFYFKISGDVSGPPVTTKAMDLVKRFAELPVANAARPLPYTILAGGLDLPIDRIAFEKDNVFQYDFLSDFWFGRDKDDSEARYFIHEGSDPDNARALFERLEREQENEYSILERESGRVLMQHEYLKSIFAMTHDGTLILGVDGAENRDRAREGLSRLRGAVRRGDQETDPTS
jgi:hypothetical protein